MKLFQLQPSCDWETGGCCVVPALDHAGAWAQASDLERLALAAQKVEEWWNSHPLDGKVHEHDLALEAIRELRAALNEVGA